MATGQVDTLKPFAVAEDAPDTPDSWLSIFFKTLRGMTTSYKQIHLHKLVIRRVRQDAAELEAESYQRMQAADALVDKLERFSLTLTKEDREGKTKSAHTIRHELLKLIDENYHQRI